MNLLLERHPPGVTCTIGELFSDGQSLTHTLERLPNGPFPCIPAGTYRVLLTVSDRAKQGTLWSPNPKSLLPLVLSVPGRNGIRIHAGNISAETEGCILVGTWTGGEILSSSRAALEYLMDLLEIEEIANRQTWLEVRDP